MNARRCKFVVCLLFTISFVSLGYAQDGEEPPPPKQQRSPGIGVPGLQLPIDDYIPYLLILGVLAGVGYFCKIERQKPTNS